MRMLVEWTMPLEPFNSMVKDGTAGAAIEKAIGAIQPEAVYFWLSCSSCGSEIG